MDKAELSHTITAALDTRTAPSSSTSNDPAVRQQQKEAVDEWRGHAKPSVGKDYFMAHKPR